MKRQRWEVLDSYGCVIAYRSSLASALDRFWLEPGDSQIKNLGGGVYEVYLGDEGTYTIQRRTS